MNHMGHVVVLQGRYDPNSPNNMGDPNETPLKFVVPDSGYLMVMAQATALSPAGGAHEVGVVFELWHGGGANPVASYEARAKGQEPGHTGVCMAYLAPTRLEPNTTAKVTIRPSGETPGGSMDGEDFFSVSVVELEQSADIASFTGGRADEASKGA